MWRPAVILALLVGCDGFYVDMGKVVPGPPGTVEAEALILERYQCTRANLYFYGPESMDCGDLGFTNPATGKCGFGMQHGNDIVVGLLYEGQPAWATSLPHEYAHRRWGDPGHTIRAVWGDNYGVPHVGPEGGLVAATRDDLLRLCLVGADEAQRDACLKGR